MLPPLEDLPTLAEIDVSLDPIQESDKNNDEKMDVDEPLEKAKTTDVNDESPDLTGLKCLFVLSGSCDGCFQGGSFKVFLALD